MRSKKSYKLLIIFGLILFLGIGYAVVNSVTLTVTGTAGAGSETIDVSFNGTKTVSNSTKVVQMLQQVVQQQHLQLVI